MRTLPPVVVQFARKTSDEPLAKRMARRLGKLAVPRRYRYLFHTCPRRSAPVTFSVNPDVRLDVFWKDGGCRGPALSVHAWGAELLRFDCTGPQDGHRHIIYGREKSGQHFMLPWPPSAREIVPQIEAAFEELRGNLRAYLHGSPYRRDRPVSVDPQALETALGDARALMLDLHMRGGTP